MTTIPAPPPSPGVGLRRKGPKALPRLPLSAFSPPNSGTSERFPLPPSPSAMHPDSVVDGNVTLSIEDANLSQWKKEAGQELGGRICGVVLSLPEGADVDKTIAKLTSSNGNTPILSFIVPFRLEHPAPPPFINASHLQISHSTRFTEPSLESVATLKWALGRGRPVDIDVQAVLSDSALENFEDLISKATDGLLKVPPIILSNILPPPHDLELPLVKLMNHPTYRAFQSQTAALSLFPDVYIKFLPPSWNAPTPPTPVGVSPEAADTKQRREWKRRIKMYLGPVLEAFGYQRIVFGSSPSAASDVPSNASDWYEIARESLAELEVGQEAVDAVFCDNARNVYGSGSP